MLSPGAQLLPRSVPHRALFPREWLYSTGPWVAGYLIDGFPPSVQCRQESFQFRRTAQVDNPGREGLLAVPGELLRRAGAQVSGHHAPSWGPASGGPHPTHQDTVLPVRFRGDGADVGQLGCAQGAEEAGLAVLMAREEAVIGDHQAAGDAGAGSHPLGDDLKGIGRRARRGELGPGRGWSAPELPILGAQPEVRQAPPTSGVQVGMGRQSVQAPGGPEPQGLLLGCPAEVPYLGPHRLLCD